MPLDKTNETLDGASFAVNHFKHNSFPDVKDHCHSFFEIFFLISPTVCTRVNEQDFTMSKGDILIVPPYANHSSSILEKNKYERVVTWVKVPYISDLFHNNIFGTDTPLHIHLTEEEYGEYCPHLIKLSEEMRRNDFASVLLCKCLLNEFLVFLARKTQAPSLSVNENPFVEKVRDYIDKNITLPLTVNDIAKTFFVSQYLLCRKFKQHTGTTVYRYIITKRLQYAKAYINEGYSISEACTLAGFSDYSNFFKQFVDEVGMTPSEFNKICQSKKHLT